MSLQQLVVLTRVRQLFTNLQQSGDGWPAAVWYVASGPLGTGHIVHLKILTDLQM